MNCRYKLAKMAQILNTNYKMVLTRKRGNFKGDDATYGSSLLGTYEDHDDDCENDDGRDEIESHQEEGDYEDGHERNAQRLQRVLPHRQVLLVEDVEDRVGEHFDMLREKK